MAVENQIQEITVDTINELKSRGLYYEATEAMMKRKIWLEQERKRDIREQKSKEARINYHKNIEERRKYGRERYYKLKHTKV